MSRSLTADQVAARKAELLTALRAGLEPGDDAYVRTYGDALPARDCFSISFAFTDRSKTELRPVARHWRYELELRFRAIYGEHDASCCWAYAVPAGVTDMTEEPEGWRGWRAAPSPRPWPPQGEEREDFDRNTREALG